MNDLEHNHRSFLVATGIMLVVAAAVVTMGMLLFPLALYVDPNAGLIPGLFNTPSGNVLIFAMLGVLAVNMVVYLNRVTSLERERNAILEYAAQEAPAAPPLADPRKGALPPG